MTIAERIIAGEFEGQTFPEYTKMEMPEGRNIIVWTYEDGSQLESTHAIVKPPEAAAAGKDALEDAAVLAEHALTTAAFVVTNEGLAPVWTDEIVTADMHEELLSQYATSGYAATRAIIRRQTLDDMATEKNKKEAAAGR